MAKRSYKPDGMDQGVFDRMVAKGNKKPTVQPIISAQKKISTLIKSNVTKPAPKYTPAQMRFFAMIGAWVKNMSEAQRSQFMASFRFYATILKTLSPEQTAQQKAFNVSEINPNIKSASGAERLVLINRLIKNAQAIARGAPPKSSFKLPSFEKIVDAVSHPEKLKAQLQQKVTEKTGYQFDAPDYSSPHAAPLPIYGQQVAAPVAVRNSYDDSEEMAVPDISSAVKYMPLLVVAATFLIPKLLGK